MRGNFVVYSHSNSSGVFYIGMGVEGRELAKSSRNELWQNETSNNSDYSVKVLGSFANREDALECEKILIYQKRPSCNLLVVNPFLDPPIKQIWVKPAMVTMLEKIANKRNKLSELRHTKQSIANEAITDLYNKECKKCNI